jgi:predicted NBD/HSP70 family sugar kinase
MDLSALRRHHLALVFEHLLEHGPASRAAMAVTTGLAKASVSSLVADLLDRGLVRELDVRMSGRRGRPAADIEVASHSVGGLGLEINVDYVAASVIDLGGETRVTFRLECDNRDRPSRAVFTDVRRLARKSLAASEDAEVLCIGATLALPGLVDPATATVVVAPNLHWLDFSGDARSHLRLPAGLQVRCDNEANLAALAELRFGIGRTCPSFVYLSPGVGIGAGVVADGRLARGAHGFAGEVGHIVVDPTGPRCGCGARGCLEVVAGPSTTDDDTAEALRIALRSVIHVLDPEAIVLGGRFARVDLAAAVEKLLEHDTLGGERHPCRVVPATFGADAALVGGATAALADLVADPTIVPLRSEPASG